MKKGICVKQKDITDCGAACLASIGIHYRLRMPVTAIRQLAGTDRRGTNVMGMIAAAEKMNFTARGVKGNIQSLRNIPLPAIAHLVLANKLHHYVVIYEVKKSSVVYMDPGDGRLIKKSFTDFQAEWSGVLVIITPAATFTKGSYTVSNYRRFWQLAKPQSGVLLQAITGSVFYTILGLSTSVFVQKIVDNVLRDNNLNLLNLMSVIMIVLMVFQFLIGILRSVFALQTGLQIDSKLIPGYYAHIMNMPQKFFDSMRVGEIISRVNDAVKIRSFVNEVALGMIVNVLIIVFSFGLMFMYYWKLALIVALVIPCYTGIYLIGNRIARRQQRALMEKGAALETQLVESLDVAGLVKRFNLELFSQVRTESRFGALLSEIYRAGKSSILLSGVSDLCTKLFTIALLWCGGYFVINRELSPGELLSFYALAGYLTTPAMALIGSNRSVQDALIAAERLYEITDLDPENDIPDAITFNKLPGGNMGNITFENVHFSYGTRATVLKGLNLEISAGSSTAITGRSGSGKSTIAGILQTLYTPTEGRVTINDLDIKYFQKRSIRDAITVVPQNVELIAGTIIENIALGDFEPSLEKIVGISRLLGIDKFVEIMPAHYYTYLEENGSNLSGGQRQRIAIARALYREPEILILDEATSNLDAQSEHFVQAAFDWFLAQGKTLIIIAHRLSTIRNCDQIIVLKDGALAGSGTHFELLESCVAYNELWNLQAPEAAR